MTNIHRIMSFNINGVLGERANRWPMRAPLNLTIFNRFRPDIIGLQEVHQTNLDTYREHLVDYNIVVGNCYGDNPPQEYTSILYKSSRYELLDTGEFWFSETPDIESADWGVEYPLGATWVKLKCLHTGRQIFHLNTHFEDGPWGEESRVNSSKLIIKRLAELASDLPVVLTGDFNWNPWSLPYQNFVDDGYVDTYLAAGNADSAESSTIHLYMGDAYFALDFGQEIYWRVDWILAKAGIQPMQTTSSTIVRYSIPPTYPSDHYPVVSEIMLQ